MQRHHKHIGLICFIAGIVLILHSGLRMTGAIVGTSDFSPAFISYIGLAFILISLMLINKSSNIDDIIAEINTKITNQRVKYKANPKFIQGLDEIQEHTLDDREEYDKSDPRVQKVLEERLRKRSESLDRREQYFFNLPFHTRHDADSRQSTIIDLPDRGLYNYRPISGKKSKFIELDVFHYTDDIGHKGIKNKLESGLEEIFHQDMFGAYFISDPLPKNLNTSTAVQALGIGKQVYTGKSAKRIPKYELNAKIKVRKERVLEKISYYDNKRGSEISPQEYDDLPDEEKQKYFRLKKYAIAGGISRKDIIGPVISRRYQHANFGIETDTKKYNEEVWKNT